MNFVFPKKNLYVNTKNLKNFLILVQQVKVA